MIIKKRFGVRNFVQYLALKDTYSIGPKVKKKKQRSLKGVSRYIYKQYPSEKELVRLKILQCWSFRSMEKKLWWSKRHKHLQMECESTKTKTYKL